MMPAIRAQKPSPRHPPRPVNSHQSLELRSTGPSFHSSLKLCSLCQVRFPYLPSTAYSLWPLLSLTASFLSFALFPPSFPPSFPLSLPPFPRWWLHNTKERAAQHHGKGYTKLFGGYRQQVAPEYDARLSCAISWYMRKQCPELRRWRSNIRGGGVILGPSVGGNNSGGVRMRREAEVKGWNGWDERMEREIYYSSFYSSLDGNGLMGGKDSPL